MANGIRVATRLVASTALAASLVWLTGCGGGEDAASDGPITSKPESAPNFGSGGQVGGGSGSASGGNSGSTTGSRPGRPGAGGSGSASGDSTGGSTGGGTGGATGGGTGGSAGGGTGGSTGGGTDGSTGGGTGGSTGGGTGGSTGGGTGGSTGGGTGGSTGGGTGGSAGGGTGGSTGGGTGGSAGGGTYPDYGGTVTVGGCSAPGPGRVPSAQLPQVSNLSKVYTIRPADWGISTNGSNAQATTSGLNQAIKQAKQEGYGTVRLPAGTYLVGNRMNSTYTSGVEVPGNIHLALDAGATIQLASTDTPHYCVVNIADAEDVKLSGGAIRGDLATHRYAGGGTHEFGTAVCVGAAGKSKRILIEGMTLSDTTGDGIVINDGPGSAQDITIRGNDISKSRRQGISVIGGINVVVEQNKIHDIGGTAPEFGIDIEGTLSSNENRSILIRNNEFYRNLGGDYVNTNGQNVWLTDNTMDQTGLAGKQGDGPIIFWRKTSQVIRGNRVTVTHGNSNGMWGLVTYPNGTNGSAVNIIEDNEFHGGGINVSDMKNVKVARNTVHDHNLVMWSLSCLQLDDNKVIDNGKEYYPYLIRDVRGKASGNLRDGKPVNIPLSPTTPVDYQ